MDKERIKEIIENPKFIRGIHNYCDRWCQRCEYTDRCSVYAMEESQKQKPNSEDSSDEAFLKDVQNLLVLILEMVREKSIEMGIDPDAIDMDQVQKEAAEKEEHPHELVLTAMNYTDQVRLWFDTHKELFEEKCRELELKHRLVLEGRNPEAEFSELKEITEVIQWYHTLIYAKIRRAMNREISENPEIEEIFMYDANGSAKIAMISIDRSIEAWSKMLAHFPEQEKDILDFLAHLKRLCRGMEQAFPEARSFIRPGLDQ